MHGSAKLIAYNFSILYDGFRKQKNYIFFTIALNHPKLRYSKAIFTVADLLAQLMLFNLADG